jgi:hypothetical protein
MNVKELIEQLNKQNPDSTILVANYGDDDGMFEYEPETIDILHDLSANKIIIKLSL